MKGKIILSLLLLLLLLPSLVFSEEEKAPKQSWKDSAELSIVQTGGNSESLTIGFKNLYEYKWESALFTFKAGAIRAENTTFIRYVLETTGEVIEEETTEKTAENYYLDGKYDRKISKNFYWYGGVGWNRNEFAGIENRYYISGGVGNIWWDTEKRKFKTDYGLQYTKETPVFEPQNFDDAYAAGRLSYNYFQKIFQASSFSQDFEWITNLEETSDFRVSLLNSLATALNSHISLKIGLDLFFDNEPAFEEIPEVNIDPATMARIPTGNTFPYELDELDYLFTTALVITF